MSHIPSFTLYIWFVKCFIYAWFTVYTFAWIYAIISDQSDPDSTKYIPTFPRICRRSFLYILPFGSHWRIYLIPFGNFKRKIKLTLMLRAMVLCYTRAIEDKVVAPGTDVSTAGIYGKDFCLFLMLSPTILYARKSRQTAF